MSRAGDHRFRRVAQFHHGLLRAGQTFGIKRDGRVVKDALNDSRHPAQAQAFSHLMQRCLHGFQRRLRRMAKLHAADHPRRHDVARVWRNLRHADRRPSVRRMPIANLLHLQRQLREGGQRVAAAVHRRRSCMGGKSVQRQGEPALAHCRADEPDIQTFVLQNRALLDVQLVAGVNRKRAGRGFTPVADVIQGFTHGDAIVIGAGMGVRFAKLPRPDP